MDVLAAGQVAIPTLIITGLLTLLIRKPPDLIDLIVTVSALFGWKRLRKRAERVMTIRNGTARVG